MIREIGLRMAGIFESGKFFRPDVVAVATIG
jgi:hypothetical protein